MNEHPGPYTYSFVAQRVAPRTAADCTQFRYWGRCVCGWRTNLHYSSPAIALSAVRRTHNALAPTAPRDE